MKYRLISIKAKAINKIAISRVKTILKIKVAKEANNTAEIAPPAESPGSGGRGSVSPTNNFCGPSIPTNGPAISILSMDVPTSDRVLFWTDVTRLKKNPVKVLLA